MAELKKSRGAQKRSARKRGAQKRSAQKRKTAAPVDRLRHICLALPEAHEKSAWGTPTFRVKNKLFAMYAAPNDHHGAGRHAVWCKATHIAQDDLVRFDEDRYFVPPYVGVSGWVGIYLDRGPNWRTVADLMRDAYRMIAPKRLAALVGER
jgi:hypothetical protein